MKHLTHIFIFLLILCQQNPASAHAVVTNYSLKLTPIQANRPDKVTLNFNSHIELGLSQFFLVSKGDKHELLTMAKSTKRGEVIVEIPALSPGDYALSFKVFAADGHLTEDVIHFSVSPATDSGISTDSQKATP